MKCLIIINASIFWTEDAMLLWQWYLMSQSAVMDGTGTKLTDDQKVKTAEIPARSVAASVQVSPVVTNQK